MNERGLAVVGPSLMKRRVAFSETFEGATDHWEMLEVEEKKVVGAMVFYSGNWAKVAGFMGWEIERLYRYFEPSERPWMLRAMEFYYNNIARLKKNVVSQHALKALVEMVEPMLESKETPPETKRKLIRDMLEADGVIQKFPTFGGQTNVQVNVAVPEWKKEHGPASPDSG